MNTQLTLQDNTTHQAQSYGAQTPTAGEVVFATGMTGYPETLTDPSYKGQILILTYPIIGSYGVPPKKHWESKKIQVSGLIVSNYIDTPSHFQSQQTLAQWFKKENLPLIEIKDTRALTQKIRNYGTLLGKITFGQDIPFYDPDQDNLVAKVSTKKIHFQKSNNSHAKTIVLIDCGAKKNIQNELLKRGVNVLTVPWNTNILNSPPDKGELEGVKYGEINFHAVLISNGPGNPKIPTQTIQTIKRVLENKIPTLGICLGHQLLTLAAGGNTQKLKYGHRSQNQPCLMKNTNRCYITTQNHGFCVSEIPPGFQPWFTNANDQTNEGIIHQTHPFMSVQFHPESTPGPQDTSWIFDYFLERIK